MLTQDVLKMLYDSKEELSGEEMAGCLGVSRNAVWKAVKSLKNEGYVIEAGTNKGYKLIKDDVISENGIKKYYNGKFNFLVKKETGSTNDDAKQLAKDGASEGTVVVAEMQTAGKGRLSRPFFSPFRSGVYLSYIFRPKMNAEDAVMVTAFTAVAVAKAIESLSGVDVGIKWVNDLFINGKKVCGILTEAGFNLENGEIDYVVIGIGINVNKNSFPEELVPIATSIEAESKTKIDRNRLVAEITKNLEEIYDQLSDRKFIDDYRKKSIVIGKEVTILVGDTKTKAFVDDISQNGSLEVTINGERKSIRAGEISLRL